ncbi:U-scoloptoxin(01)-Er1a-like 3 [Homarus americanus]|uniref:U-scoloptoxin(01)-Er1a-like 3 n=1 Tax=Homarus americanus TaxID=6706 RepID=A0A8J5MVJ5_HOMAM|nr:U-scoloptoxin(01)-Er1a-like 3 [Homarus americanus]
MSFPLSLLCFSLELVLNISTVKKEYQKKTLIFSVSYFGESLVMGVAVRSLVFLGLIAACLAQQQSYGLPTNDLSGNGNSIDYGAYNNRNSNGNGNGNGIDTNGGYSNGNGDDGNWFVCVAYVTVTITQSQLVFHICQDGGRIDSFLCPNGTIFNQQFFVCDWWYNFNCSNAEQFYDLNALIGVFNEDNSGNGVRTGMATPANMPPNWQSAVCHINFGDIGYISAAPSLDYVIMI